MGLAPQHSDSAFERLCLSLEEIFAPQDTGIGYMEFFDWLAWTSDQELALLANVTHQSPMSPKERYELGLEVWAKL